MAKMLVLTVVTGTQIGKKYTLPGRVSVVGSATGCDLQVHDRLIEPRHAELRSMLDSWFIVPLAPNGAGLSINGAVVRAQSRVRPGDRLTIGATTYSVAVEEVLEREVGAPAASSNGVPRFGEYLIQRGLMTPEQVQRTADRQATLQRSGVSKQFGEVAYEMGYLNRSQLERVVSDQRSDFNARWRD